MKRNVLSFFPHKTFRRGQKETILKIIDLYEQGFKNVMVEMPTGGGKSSIAFTIAKYFNSAYTITPQKLLQDQYGKDVQNLDIKNTVLFKGKSNYPCKLFDDKMCDACILPLKKECKYESSCHYLLAQDKAIYSSNAIVNYHVLHTLDRKLYAKAGNDYVTYEKLYKRDILICDEAHSIENFLMGQVTVRIPTPHLSGNEHLSNDDIKTIITNNIESLTAEIYRNEKEVLSLQDDSPRLIAIVKSMSHLERECDKLKHLQTKLKTDNWVFIKYKDKHGFFAGYEAKPIMVSEYSKMIFRAGDKKLFLSATLPTVNVFCKSLGLKKSETFLIKTDNHFPVQNRPVYFLPPSKYTPITYRNIQTYGHNTVFSPLVKVIENILDYFHDKKGIIITNSNAIMEHITREINRPERFINCSGITRDNAISHHCSVKAPTVLVGPNLYEGLDLKHDLGRFCIIVKCPYPPEDDQIRARRDKDSDWYNNQIALKITQGLGRCCRAEDDHCMNFVIDPSIINFMYKRGRNFIPRYIHEALKPMPTCFL